MEKPEGWADRTMTIYAVRGPSGFDANIVLARDAMQPKESFEAYAARQEATFRNSLPDFKLERSQEGMVKDYPAYELLFTWQSATGLLRQRAMFISVGRGRIATYASTAAAEDYEGMEEAFDDAFATLDIDGGEPPAPPPQFQN